MKFYIYNDEYYRYGRKSNNVENRLPNYKTEITAPNLKIAKEIFLKKYVLNPFYFTFSETELTKY